MIEYYIVLAIVIIVVLIFIVINLNKITAQLHVVIQNNNKPEITKIQPKVEPSVESLDTFKQKLLFPKQIQAFENLTLFLETIEPSNLVMKLRDSNLTAIEFHSKLIQTISNEYEKNISEQLYVSNNSWDLCKQAKEETISILNTAANKLENAKKCDDLVRKIFEEMMVLEKSPSSIALNYLKLEFITNK